MRTKTKYRQAFKSGGRVDELKVPVDAAAETPAQDVPPVPAELPPAPPAAPQPEQPRQDDATLALKRQIESLRQSEQVRQQAPMPQEPMSREARLAQWQAQGLSAAEAHFLQRHPEMVDFPQVTNFAAHRATEAGHQRGTDEYFAEVEKVFNASMAHLQAQESPQPMPQPTPEFFTPPAARPSRVGYSAPVSRSIPSGGSGRRSPGKVTLSPQEVEAARNSGISPEEYARQKVRYQNMREDGSYSDARDLK